MSVTRPFDSSPALYYKRSFVTMRLSGTVTEIWRLKYWTDGRGHGKKDGRRERERGRGRGRKGTGKEKWKGKRKEKMKEKKDGR